MPTLQELLAQSSPDQLKQLLNSAPKNSSSVDDLAQAQPTPGPTPMPGPAPSDDGKSPMATSGIGPLANASQYGQLITPNGPVADKDKYASLVNKQSDDSDDDSDEDSDSGKTNQLTRDKMMEMMKQLRSPASPDQSQALQAMTGNPGFTNNTVDALKKVQAEQDAAHKDARFTNAANLVGAGIAGLGAGSVVKNTMDSDYKDLAKDDHLVKNFDALTEQEKNDPNSTYSVGMKAFAGPMMAKLGIKLPENMSAAQMASVSPMIVKMYDAKQADETNRLKIQELNETRRMHDQMLNEGRKDKADEKASKDQDKAYTDLRKNIETFRGNSGAQQAAKDVLSADKAMMIVKNKDPNKLTTQDLSVLAGELSKIATGGVPTEHGLQALMPSNLQTKYAELQNFLMSKPSDAQAGAYIRKNMAYLDDMKNVAAQSLNTYKANIARGYMGRINEDQKKEFLTDYPDLQPLFQKGTNVKSVSPINQPPKQDPKVAQYAKEHMNGDYDSALKLLTARGYTPGQ